MTFELTIRGYWDKMLSYHWTPIYGFLLQFNSNIWPIFAPLSDINLPNLSDLDIDLSIYLMSNVIILLGTLYMVSYYCLLVTWVQFCLIYDIKAFKIWVTLTLTFKVTKVKCNHTNGSPYMLSCWVTLTFDLWPNSGPLEDIRLWNLSDPEFDI